MTVQLTWAAVSALDSVPGEVRKWRSRWLVASGFPPWLAETVTSDPEVDVHALSQLVDQGCAPELAVRILAPLPEQPR
ncbi:hypothetical protein [Nocardia caishijiensis]|uniref:Uncharacterized protein n=1 Tax=Nocardia caishijiensis TaxID=184756 RepID=A0ABQ6YJC5_9NOCA|nr:hypothetical protein [Nocardia caishijiensis]KAF0845748.1 hypothetical protein FNL39_106136 [Nocardia caishijiensis]